MSEWECWATLFPYSAENKLELRFPSIEAEVTLRAVLQLISAELFSYNLTCYSVVSSCTQLIDCVLL